MPYPSSPHMWLWTSNLLHFTHTSLSQIQIEANQEKEGLRLPTLALNNTL
jgi:hypothetical protein